MNINLMPREPLFYRFFYVWLTLAIVFIIAFAIACYQLYTLEVQAASKLEQQIQQLSATKDELSKEIAAYREREKFWEENEPYYRYQDVVEFQAEQTKEWGRVMSEMEKALPRGGQLFQLEVTDKVVQGLGVVHSVEGVASFMHRMQKAPMVDQFTLEVVNAPEEFAPLYIEQEQATVFRFRFNTEQSEQADNEDRGTANEA